MDQQPPTPSSETEAPVQPAASVPPPATPDYWKKPKRRWPLYAAIALAAIIIAAAIYWFLLRSTPATKSPSAPATTQTKPRTPSQTVPTKAYSSSNFNLSFNYPQDWAITDSGNGQLRAVSPATQIKSANGQNVTGQIVMTIANQGQNLSVFDKGNATAVLASQKIAYTSPTQNQRANTYLSFLQYASTTQNGALDGVYITGDNGYQKGQDVPKSDVAGITPLVSVTFIQCANSACSGSTTALSVAASAWSDTSLSGPVTKMLESLAFN